MIFFFRLVSFYLIVITTISLLLPLSSSSSYQVGVVDALGPRQFKLYPDHSGNIRHLLYDYELDTVIAGDSISCELISLNPNTLEPTILAGTGSSGTADSSVGTSATIGAIYGVTFLVDSSDGSILDYLISDYGASALRRVGRSSPHAVTTVAGVAGSSGDVAGVGTAARMNQPRGLDCHLGAKKMYLAGGNTRRVNEVEWRQATSNLPELGLLVRMMV